MLIRKIAYGYTRVAAWSALRRSMRQHRKFVSTSRSTATRWLAIFTRCTMSGCAVGGSDFLNNRSDIPVRTFWRNAMAMLLCSTPSSIVELRRSRQRNKVLRLDGKRVTRSSAVRYLLLSVAKSRWRAMTVVALSPPVPFRLFSSGGLASARESLCRGLGSRRFTERFHRNALVTHFQHGKIFCTARQLKDYTVTRCRLHQRAPQR